MTRFFRLWRKGGAAGAMIALVLCSTAASGVDNAPARRRPHAWIDANGICAFPLSSGELPRSRQELIASLSGAWEHSLTLPDPAHVVAVEGGRYPAVDRLNIDLSDATLHPKEGKEQRIVPSNRPERRLGVGDFHLQGTPVICEKAKLNFDITAANVGLEMEHDRSGRPILLLAHARQAVLQFDALPRDLARIALAATREAGAPYGLAVDSVDLHFEAQSPRSITVDMHLRTRFAFVPAGMHFHAHVDVDDRMNAKISGLSCTGDEVLGPLIVGLLRPSLEKAEGKTRPLISFPADMKLRDVVLKVDDAVHLTAAFGS